MLDMKFVRENPELVKENIKKKFQDEKLPLVDQVIELDERRRAAMTKADELRANRNKLSKEIGALMAQGKKEEGMALRQKVADQAKELEELTSNSSAMFFPSWMRWGMPAFFFAFSSAAKPNR